MSPTARNIIIVGRRLSSDLDSDATLRLRKALIGTAPECNAPLLDKTIANFYEMSSITIESYIKKSIVSRLRIKAMIDARRDFASSLHRLNDVIKKTKLRSLSDKGEEKALIAMGGKRGRQLAKHLRLARWNLKINLATCNQLAATADLLEALPLKSGKPYKDRPRSAVEEIAKLALDLNPGLTRRGRNNGSLIAVLETLLEVSNINDCSVVIESKTLKRIGGHNPNAVSSHVNQITKGLLRYARKSEAT